MSALLIQIVQGLLALAIAPGLIGLMRVVRARAARRRGPGLLQPYRDLHRLLMKERLLIEGSGPLYATAPTAILCLLTVGLWLLPMASRDLLTGGQLDLLVLAGLLAMARLVQLLAALDSGTAFAGIGAGREILITVSIEPVLLITLYTLMSIADSSGPATVSAALSDGGIDVSLALALAGFTLVVLAEAGRLPFDNPATHLELTMVHEAMVLDYSGRDLAMIQMAQAVRLTLLLALTIALFAPFGIAVPGDWSGFLIGLPLWGLKMAGMAAGLAVAEACLAKLRVFRIPELLGLALLASGLAVVFRLLAEGA